MVYTCPSRTEKWQTAGVALHSCQIRLASSAPHATRHGQSYIHSYLLDLCHIEHYQCDWKRVRPQTKRTAGQGRGSTPPETRNHSRTSRVNCSVFVVENTWRSHQQHQKTPKPHENTSARTRENPTHTQTRTHVVSYWRLWPNWHWRRDFRGRTAHVSHEYARTRPHARARQPTATTTTRAQLSDATAGGWLDRRVVGDIGVRRSKAERRRHHDDEHYVWVCLFDVWRVNVVMCELVRCV